MTIVKRWVTVRTSFKGIHNWPGCPHEEVSFLRHPHRHVFHIQLSIEVSETDREIEFFILQKTVDKILAERFEEEEGIVMLGAMSCEMIADAIYSAVTEEYPGRNMRISVSEDGENEATCEYHSQDAT
jgi:hypothetical protein